jgi:ABC-type methionine transport system ATPase subunit
MVPDMETIRVQLNYPLERVKEPILYQLVMKFGLIPSIRRANIDIRTGGFIYLDLSGEKNALESGLRWLEEQGVIVNAIGLDGTQEWAI